MSDNELYNEWHRVTTNDNEWQRVIQQVAANDSKWKKVVLGFKTKQKNNMIPGSFYLFWYKN